jgi:hypothetical protein
MSRWERGILILALVAAGPACGSGGGGGGALPVFSTPTVFASTPVGIQHSVVPIDFTVTDAESDPVAITVEFSTNDGTTFAPATPAYGNGPLTGLPTSPGGTVHTFLWNSVSDAVATGTVVYAGGIATVGTVNPLVRIRIVPAGGKAGTTSKFTVNNTMDRATGAVSATFLQSFTELGKQETAEGDLVADAMRLRYGVQLCLQNGWGIRAPLPTSYAPADTSLRRPLVGYAAGPPYDLVLADIYVMLPFSNRVVTRTVTGSQLWAMLEHGVSLYPANHNGFPQISGFSFTFDESNAAGSRVLSVTLAGGAPIANDATVYTFATNDFLNAGGDGYAMLNDGQGVTQELMAQVVADYIEAAGLISPTIGGRITVVP